MKNEIVEKFATHGGFSDEAIGRTLAEISGETGFAPDGEIQRRFIYDPDKTWRVRIRGTFEGKPTLLRIENLKLEVDEESIREAFRKNAAGQKVRPPFTFVSRPFDDAKGYGWSLDEDVGGKALFDPEASATDAIASFAPFYREYSKVTRDPFWPAPDIDTIAFTKNELEKWTDVARSQDPSRVNRFSDMLGRLRDAMFARLAGKPLVFQHAHLSGADVRVADDGTYVVFANHFWSWRQPGYDVSFPIWGQWLALPDGKRTPEAVKEITSVWLDAVERDLSDLTHPDEVVTMLLNRLYGSLILDIPAQRHGRSPESVAALESACIAEADRLLS